MIQNWETLQILEKAKTSSNVAKKGKIKKMKFN